MKIHKNIIKYSFTDNTLSSVVNDYLDDPEPDKDEAISIHEFAATLDIKIT